MVRPLNPRPVIWDYTAPGLQWAEWRGCRVQVQVQVQVWQGAYDPALSAAAEIS